MIHLNQPDPKYIHANFLHCLPSGPGMRPLAGILPSNNTQVFGMGDKTNTPPYWSIGYPLLLWLLCSPLSDASVCPHLFVLLCAPSIRGAVGQRYRQPGCSTCEKRKDRPISRNEAASARTLIKHWGATVFDVNVTPFQRDDILGNTIGKITSCWVLGVSKQNCLCPCL